MNIKRFSPQSKTQFLFVFTLVTLLNTGCQAVNPVIETPGTITNPVRIQTPDPVDEILSGKFNSLTFDFSNLAKDRTFETIPAILPIENSPYWEIMPEHNVIKTTLLSEFLVVVLLPSSIQSIVR